jgi:hypothetical protein
MRVFTFLKGILITTGAGVVVIVIEGILGNRADGIFVEEWPVVENLIMGHIFACICITLVIVLFLFLLLYCRQRQRIAEHMSEIKHKLLDLDDSFIRALALLSPSSQIEQEVQRVLTDLLRDATAVFEGEVQRAAILVLNPAKDYLECLASYEMPQASIQNMKFYVGSDLHLLDIEKGIAGETFITGEMIVGHLSQINGNWVCDNENYKKFVGRRPYPPYTSFVNVPVIGISSRTPYAAYVTCLGVLCFDSSNKKIFDSEESKVILRTIARRASAALLIYQQYQNMQILQP